MKLCQFKSLDSYRNTSTLFYKKILPLTKPLLNEIHLIKVAASGGNLAKGKKYFITIT